MAGKMENDLPPGFAGWLEEHPGGAFMVDLIDRTFVTLRTHDEVVEFLQTHEPDEIASVTRVRQIFDPMNFRVPEAKLYPPDETPSRKEGR